MTQKEGHIPGGDLHAWHVRMAEILSGRVTKRRGRMSWRSRGHPPCQLHFEKGDLYAMISLS